MAAAGDILLLGMLADAGDLLVAISSSGKSPNILNAIKAASG